MQLFACMAFAKKVSGLKVTAHTVSVEHIKHILNISDTPQRPQSIYFLCLCTVDCLHTEFCAKGTYANSLKPFVSVVSFFLPTKSTSEH